MSPPQADTRVLGLGVLFVRRSLKPAENEAHREKIHLAFLPAFASLA